MSDLLSLSPSRWAIPFLVFLTIYTPFSAADKVINKDVKDRLATYISSNGYVDAANSLPRTTMKLFDYIFGEKHLSVKSILRSFMISVFSLISLFAFTFFYNPKLLSSFFREFSSGYIALVHALSNNPKTSGMAHRLLQYSYFGNFALIFIGWIFWSFIPDYLSLLKSRIIILIFNNRPPSIFGTLSTLVFDFVVSTVIFFLSASIFQAIFLVYVISPNIFDHSMNTIAVELSLTIPFIFGIEMMLLLPHGTVFYIVPLANLFWASIIPSVWLWLYLFSAFCTRIITRNQARLTTISRLFDLQSMPCTFLGILAGLLCALATVIFLAISTIYQLLLS